MTHLDVPSELNKSCETVTEEDKSPPKSKQKKNTSIDTAS